MLLMFSVALPVLASVTLFVALVAPTTVLAKVNEAGVSIASGAKGPFTDRLTLVVALRLPEAPVIVTVTGPGVPGAHGVAASVNVLVVVVGFGTNAAVTPLGMPDALSVTPPAKPPSGYTVIVLVKLPPGDMLASVGLTDRVKLGPEAPESALMRPEPVGLPQPVTRS
jgi:hypothetical protein